MLEFAIQHETIRQKKYAQLSAKFEKILEVVALAYVRQERLSVKDLMSKAELGSPAVIHVRMKALIAAQWIELHDTEDPRRYQVTPSEKMLTYFDALGRAIKSLSHSQ